MKDYYTLMELLMVLKKENSEIVKSLNSLDVFLEFKEGLNSFDYEFDYFLDNGVYLKYIRKNISGLDKLIYGLKNQNECTIFKDENNNYRLGNNTIAKVKDVYQKYFDELVEKILQTKFLNVFFIEDDFIYKDELYHIVITPKGMYIKKQKDNKVECQLVFDVNSNIINCIGANNVIPNLSILKIKIPKSIFTSEMNDIIEKQLVRLSSDELSLENLCEIDNEYNYLSFMLDTNNSKHFNRKKVN